MMIMVWATKAILTCHYPYKAKIHHLLPMDASSSHLSSIFYCLISYVYCPNNSKRYVAGLIFQSSYLIFLLSIAYSLEVTCVCVFTSIHGEDFICLEQLRLPGKISTMLCWRCWILLLVPFISTLKCRS